MSFEIRGNNNFKGIPLIDTTADVWAEGINRCDPLFRNLAAVGLSALCYGVEQSSSPDGLSGVEFGELFDDSGKFVGAALRRQIKSNRDPLSQYPDHFDAGVRMTTAAFVASRLFGTFRNVNEDYTAQNGLRYVQRRTEMLVPPSKSSFAGQTMNTYPVRAIQARVCTEAIPNPEYADIELDFAATLSGPGSLPWCASTSLICSTDFARQTVEAMLISGSRQGDFVRVDGHTDFNHHLDRFAAVVYDNIS